MACGLQRHRRHHRHRNVRDSRSVEESTSGGASSGGTARDGGGNAEGLATVRLADGTVQVCRTPLVRGDRNRSEGTENQALLGLTPMATPRRQLMVCLRNDGYEVSLERRKIYPALPDADAAKHGQVRIIDESGEDYFVSGDVPCANRPPSGRSAGGARRGLTSRCTRRPEARVRPRLKPKRQTAEQSGSTDRR